MPQLCVFVVSNMLYIPRTRFFPNQLLPPVWYGLGERRGSRDKAGISEQGRDATTKKARVASPVLRMEPGTVHTHPWYQRCKLKPFFPLVMSAY